MRALILQVSDRLNARDKWLIGYIGKWLLLILAFILYSLIIARVSFAKAERQFEAWQVEYAEGYMRHMEAVEENMPRAVEAYREGATHKAEMDEYWRTRK